MEGVKNECRYCGTFIGKGLPQDMNIHYKTPEHMFNFLNFGLDKSNKVQNKMLFDMYMKGSDIEKVPECESCNMKFNSYQIFEQHLKTKKHLKNYKKYEKRQNKQSENSSDYEDVEMNEDIKKCLLCTMILNDENIIEHYKIEHKYPIPNCLEEYKTLNGIKLNNLFMDTIIDFYYKDKSCPCCLKGFLDILHLKNHIKDTDHYYYSKEFVIK